MSAPGIAACFLVHFDNRKGYTLKWQRTDDEELQLEGVIEFKCLPSGLHNVEEDLIYFVHDKYVGLAAFQSAEATEAERNARFMSVGILAARERIWLHAPALKDLARQTVQDSDASTHLEHFWHTQKSSDRDGVPSVPETGVFDPTVAASDMLETLGALVFPIYRALLLRKRVLFLSQPPLLPVCSYVHLLSELGDVPSMSDLSSFDKPPSVQSLYTIGVHDLTSLTTSAAWQGSFEDAEHSEESTASGWLACTSDELLATKLQLSEYRIKLPNNAQAGSTNSPWPVITQTVDTRQEAVVKATQRDLRRFKALTHTLADNVSSDSYTDSQERVSGPSDNEENDRAHLLPSDESHKHSPNGRVPHESTIVEPVSWTASLNSWSAQSVLDSEHEHEQDHSLLEAAKTQSQHLEGENAQSSTALFLRSYFGGLTKSILSTLSERVAAMEVTTYHDEAQVFDDNDSSPLMQGSELVKTMVRITRQDMITMGLDPWSSSDIAFAKEMARLYFGREAEVEAASVEVCGLKIC